MKKNKYIIEIPIETLATKEVIEEEIKHMACDYQVLGYLELKRPLDNFSDNKTVVKILNIKVR